MQPFGSVPQRGDQFVRPSGATPRLDLGAKLPAPGSSDTGAPKWAEPNIAQTSRYRVGKDVWVDVDDIPGGAEWRTRIERGIETCRGFLFWLSPASLASDHCRQELELAVALKKLRFRSTPSRLTEPTPARGSWMDLPDYAEISGRASPRLSRRSRRTCSAVTTTHG